MPPAAQVTLYRALEERKLYIPALRTWYQVDKQFYLIAAMNPSEQRGTRRLPGAIKDRIKVWVQLAYPKRAVELKIVRAHCGEYELSPARIEAVLELVHSTREEPAVEQPQRARHHCRPHGVAWQGRTRRKAGSLRGRPGNRRGHESAPQSCLAAGGLEASASPSVPPHRGPP